jgi:hypothetical protein
MKVSWTNLFKVVVPLVVFTEVGMASPLLNKLENSLEIDYQYTCDSIVETIINTSEKRLRNINYSIVQILNRKKISISESDVECLGTAITNNGKTVGLEYGAFKDSQNDWLIQWKLK